MDHEALMRMTRQELHELACNTADPETLSDDVIARMKELRVGPFAFNFFDIVNKATGRQDRA